MYAERTGFTKNNCKLKSRCFCCFYLYISVFLWPHGKANLCSTLRSCAASNRLSCWAVLYLEPTIFPSAVTSSSVPCREKKASHNMMRPPSYFTLPSCLTLYQVDIQSWSSATQSIVDPPPPPLYNCVALCTR